MRFGDSSSVTIHSRRSGREASSRVQLSRASTLYAEQSGQGYGREGGILHQRSACLFASFCSRVLTGVISASAIRYAVNLYEHHGMDLSSAYASAVAQFRSLRSELQTARAVALTEAEHLGMEFGPSQVEITFAKEEKAFNTFRESAAESQAAETERKRWKAVVEREGPPEQWTRGQEYTRLWKEGVRPVYAPVFVEPEIKPEGLASPEQEAQRVATSADYMNLIQARRGTPTRSR